MKATINPLTTDISTLLTLEHVTCNSFPWNKDGYFRTPILCPNMDKKEWKLHLQENVRATLHPNKDIF